MKNRLLIIVTNVDSYDKTDKPTGYWLSELTHFYDLFEKHGFEQDIASPKGGPSPPDPRSLGLFAMDKSTRARFEDNSFMSLLQDTRTIDDVDPAAYDAIYFCGGHGVMWDFPDDEKLQQLTRTFYESGKIVSAVCHGYCALPNVRLSDGSHLVQGKRLTGYSWLEEIAAGVAKHVPYNIEKLIKERGADYRKALLPFMPYVQVDGNLITGQNPFSAKATAQKVYEILSTQK